MRPEGSIPRMKRKIVVPTVSAMSARKPKTTLRPTKRRDVESVMASRVMPEMRGRRPWTALPPPTSKRRDAPLRSTGQSLQRAEISPEPSPGHRPAPGARPPRSGTSAHAIQQPGILHLPRDRPADLLAPTELRGATPAAALRLELPLLQGVEPQGHRPPPRLDLLRLLHRQRDPRERRRAGAEALGHRLDRRQPRLPRGLQVLQLREPLDRRSLRALRRPLPGAVPRRAAPRRNQLLHVPDDELHDRHLSSEDRAGEDVP